MSLSDLRFWAMGVLVAVMMPFGSVVHGQSAPAKKNKVIIYPTGTESVSQLKERGIDRVVNYGSYWLVEAADDQVKSLSASYGDRAISGNYLNYIELQAMPINTAAGEPAAVPADLQQTEMGGRRLRLIQFKGPIIPEWLEQVKALKNVEIVLYIPNNAYVIFTDAQTEKKIEALRDPAGPIQWMGAYHPYYKLSSALQKATGTIDVSVAVVDAPEGQAALDRIRSYAEEISGSEDRLLNQRIIRVRINAAALNGIARMPEVLWIDPVIRIRPMDEVQALILASDTNSPPPGVGGPLSGGTNYLDWLTSRVGGGLASFTNPLTYPVVDIADSGFTLAPGGTLGIDDFLDPTSADSGRPYRILYAYNDLSCGTFTIPKMTMTVGSSTITCVKHLRGVGEDALAFPHGTAIASIIAGFNTNTTTGYQDPSGFQFGMGISPYGLIGSTRVFEPFIVVDYAEECLYHVDDLFCVTNFRQLIQNEYFPGGRISNNSWDESLVVGENDGVYGANCLTYDYGVRDAVLTGTTNTPSPFPLNQELIVVFANGNKGSSGNVGGFADITVTPPATSKNVISVGATKSVRMDDSGCASTLEENNSYNIAGYSAFGPTRDGRIKPEIVAPDTSIYGVLGSFWLNDGAIPTSIFSPGYEGDVVAPGNITTTNGSAGPYVCGSGANSVVVEMPKPTPANGVVGTSFAAPAVSGGIQLLWWYFQNRLTNEVGQALLQPSPAMAKAYLCNSARYLPITNPQTGAKDTLPSIAQGMGMMDLARMFDGVHRVIRDESTPRAIDTPLITTNPAPQQTYFSRTGQSYEVSGQVLSNGLPFRVTLAWTDTPGAISAFTELVNELYLTVTIGGQTYKGNVFSEDHSVVGGTYDGVNNMQSVFLPPSSGLTGAWKVVVQAMNIAGDGVPNVGSSLDQDFALVVYNGQNPSDVPNLATNNSCQTAMVITTSPFSFTNTLNKTVYHNVHPSPAAGRGGVDEFFKINLPTPGGVFTIDTTGTSFDNVLSVWKVQVIPQTVFIRGECGALVEVASGAGGLSSAVTFTADGSNDYYIVVEPHNDGPGGTMVLNVSATAPAIAVTPSSLVFPDEIAGLTSAVQTVTYKNNTTATIGISSVSFAGSNAADFVIESQGCEGNSLARGQSCSIDVAFAPTTNGLRNAQLVINDDATGSPRIVPLSGNGLPSAPVVCVRSSLAFGSLFAGSTNTMSVTITNCGTAALFITNIVVSGTAASEYIVSPDTCSGNSISPHSNCTFGVSFAPITNGLRSALLTINNNAASSPDTVSLTGTGQVRTAQACLSVGSSIAFGSQSSGTTSTPYSVTITNCGTAVLTNFSVSLTGADAGEFILSGGTCSGGIAIGSTCSFGVRYAPTNMVAATASVVISNNSPINPRFVTLTGTGTSTRPDLLISTKTKAKTFVGNHVYDPPAIQTITKSVKHGKKGVFYVAVQNDGNTAGPFRIVESEISTNLITVKYFLGAKAKDAVDITSAVEGAGYTTASLAPGAITGDATMIRMEVTVSTNATKGTIPYVKVSGFSNPDSGTSDTVEAQVLVK